MKDELTYLNVRASVLSHKPFTYQEARSITDTLWDEPDRAFEKFQQLVLRWAASCDDSIWSPYSRAVDLHKLTVQNGGPAVSAAAVRRHLLKERVTPRLEVLAAILHAILKDLKSRA